MLAETPLGPLEATIVVVGFFLLLAFLAALRTLTRRYGGMTPPWRRIRIGVFVERETNNDIDDSKNQGWKSEQ